MRISRPLTGIVLGLLLLSSSGVCDAMYYIPYPTQTYAAPVAPIYYNNGSSSNAVAYVKSRGIMNGYADGSFGEAHSVNRAEFATIVLRIYAKSVPNTYTASLPYADTSNNAWYAPAVVYVYGNGLMSGYGDNTFHPYSAVTFNDAAKTFALVYHLSLNTSNTDTTQKYIRALSDVNAIPLSITSDNQSLTRGQLADIIYRLDNGDSSQPSQTYTSLAGYTPYVDTSSYYNNGYNNSTCGYNSAGRYVCNGVNNNCYYDSYGRYLCNNSYNYNQNYNYNYNYNNNCSTSCSYDANGQRICTSNQCGNNCYYDSYNHYICPNTTSNNCYYDSYGRYRCNGNNNNNCYYTSAGRYICPSNPSSNCTYNSNGSYICRNSTSSNCYYDSQNRYICSDNNVNGNCYYDSNGRYLCNNSNTSNNCYYNSYGNYICNNNYNYNYNSNSNNCYSTGQGTYSCSNNNNSACWNSFGQYICNY